MQVSNHGRVAFIFFPPRPETMPLDTMPFAAHIIKQLAGAHCQIDVFCFNSSNSSYPDDLFLDNVRYKHVKVCSARNKMKFAELTLRFARYMRYKSVFSVGLIGSYIGGLVSAVSRCPFVLLNDEFPSMYEQPNMHGYSGWLPLERWAARRADAIVVPSDNRVATLRDELQLNTDKPFITVRNTPELKLPSQHIDWHKCMGIPRGKKIFINAGSLTDWAQVPEILASASYWPAEVVVLLHNSRASGDELASYRRQLSHLDNPERVFWSSDLLPEKMLNSLVSYCAGSFALYRNTGSNFEQVGTSSGKLMRSIVCCTPVITSNFESLNFVSKEGVGLQVTHPSEIPGAVENLIRNTEKYRARCAQFVSAEKTLREEAWNRIVQCIEGSPRRRASGPFSEVKMSTPSCAIRQRR